jgi:hypothetical protein
MVMVKSQSRSRDSYHLAALIAHQYLLDGDEAALAAEAEERTPRRRRSLIAVGAMAAAVIAVLGAVYLFSNRGDSRLTFKQGELFYSVPVTEDEARRVGEYLVQRQIFSDEQRSTVQFHQVEGQYRLQFVISPEYVDDPVTAIEFGMVGRHIAAELLGGKPVEVNFTDAHLKLIKVVPLSAIIMFGKSELYYSEPVTDTEANSVGNQLVKAGYFNDSQAAAVHIARENDAFQLKFVINPAYKDDPGIKAAFIELSRGIASDALKGHPVVLHLCDGSFHTLYSERLTYGPTGLTLFYNRS